MKPEDLAKPGTEHAHQVALFCWAAQNVEKYPVLEWMYAIPNGGERNIIVAGRLRAEGVKSGVSDVCLPVPKRTKISLEIDYLGLYIEMKKPVGGRESKEQKAFGAFVTAQGYMYKCCYSWEEARDTIIEYLE